MFPSELLSQFSSNLEFQSESLLGASYFQLVIILAVKHPLSHTSFKLLQSHTCFKTDINFYYHIFPFNRLCFEIISEVIAAYAPCGDVQPHPLLIRYFRDRANYIRLEKTYFQTFFSTVNSCILSLDINVYHHIFPLNR